MKHYTRSKTIRFNALLGSFPFLVAILLWLQGILTGDGFQETLIAFLNVLGVEANAAFVGSVVTVLVAVIGIILRFVTTESIVVEPIVVEQVSEDEEQEL